jgi:S-DNA-T family DNA segregation ATPase FtsK/SpoIIIE
VAKVRTRPRPRLRRAGATARPRPSVGKRRGRPSAFSSLSGFLFRLEAVGILLLVLALIAIPSLVPATRGLTDLRDGFVRTFGLLVFAFIGLLAYVGLAVLRRRLDETFADWRTWAVAALIAAFASGLLGFFRPDWTLGGVTLNDVTAGGDLGHFLASNPIGIIIWLASGAAAFALITPAGAAATARSLGRGLAAAWAWQPQARAWRAVRAFSNLVFPTRTPPRGTEKIPLDSVIWAQDAGPTTAVHETPKDLIERLEPPIQEEAGESRKRSRQEKVAAAPEIGEQIRLPLNGGAPEEDLAPVDASAPRKAHDGWQLPPLDILMAVAPQEGQPDNSARARLIEETLASYGVDARVVQVNEGPTVTQFGIEPGWEVRTRQVPERDASGRPALDSRGQPRMFTEEVSRTRVRVNQITALANDLALALAAPSLRIESPVPGKPFVGIEVPNTSAALVTLRSVIESAQFRRLSLRSRLALALGQSVAGEPIVADLDKMPHLLIAGATGSGKSVAINAVIACILMHASPEEVRFVMIDPKRVELSAFARIPHLAFSSIVTDVDKVVGTLQAVIHEMETRYRRFSTLAVRNIDAYNKHPRCPHKLPYWLVVIDELADLMMAAPYEVEKQICRLAQLARATGIHLVLATQRPSVDVVTGLIKANFPTRIAFAMSSHVDSRTILDTSGAEKLLGRGDMLYLPTDAAKPRRLQGVYVSDQEIERLVSFWTQDRFQELEREVFDHLLEEAQEKLRTEETGGDGDPMLPQAIDLAREHQRISTSMLQRRLRIGYPRAARMMDMLEEQGVVGPPEQGGQSRMVRLGMPTAVADEEE